MTGRKGRREIEDGPSAGGSHDEHKHAGQRDRAQGGEKAAAEGSELLRDRQDKESDGGREPDGDEVGLAHLHPTPGESGQSQRDDEEEPEHGNNAS